jgi:hypothetical protein
MTDDEVNADLEPLFAVIRRWYRASHAASMAAIGRKPKLQPEVLEWLTRAEICERYHRRRRKPTEAKL